MFKVLLHSSKTMRPSNSEQLRYQAPIFLKEADELNSELSTLDTQALASLMQMSTKKASETKQLIDTWSSKASGSRPAIDAFLGDIYSGLQVRTFSDDDRDYANEHLLILSGLYGALRPLDSIKPYRLEMGYPLKPGTSKNLYEYWGHKVSDLLKPNDIIINLSAVEYTKSHLKYVTNDIITPKFLSVSPVTGKPTFVTVHAKIARGAFAHWLIKNRVDTVRELNRFNKIGYVYDEQTSTSEQPVYICKEFKGLGLSVRLT